MISQLKKYLAGKIAEDVDRMSSDLAMGCVKDFAEYRYSCGVVRGLLMAKTIIMDVTTASSVEDDDEDNND